MRPENQPSGLADDGQAPRGAVAAPPAGRGEQALEVLARRDEQTLRVDLLQAS